MLFICAVGESVWPRCPRGGSASGATTPSTRSQFLAARRARQFKAMLDLEVQKLIQDGKIKVWLDIDINDTRASYQRAVDFVGAKNLACASARRARANP